MRVPTAFMLFALSTMTAAATVEWSGFGVNIDDHYGRGVGLIGDVTGDGVEDFAVGAVGVNDWTGRVDFHDGATRQVISTIDGEGIGYRLGGRIVAAGNFDCDPLGVADVAVASVKWGQEQVGKVYVFSGPTPGYQSLLLSVTGTTSGDGLGDAISGRLDLNQDGCGDLLVGSPWNDDGGTNAGKVQVLGGPDGRVLLSVVGTAVERQFGISAAHADINDDGVEDIIVGTFYSSGIGKAYVYSGADGSLLITRSGAASRDRFGAHVGSAGDFNRDGFDDFIVAAPGGGKFYVYAGPTGQLIFTGSEVAESFSPMGDVNGDGFDDFAVGIPSSKAGGKRVGKINVYGGGALLGTIAGSSANADFGYYMSGGKDLTGDGLVDLLAGAPGFNKKGAAYLLSLF
jgi:hypothetical protein